MKKKTGITVIGAFVALLLLAVALGVALVEKYTPNKEYVRPEEAAPVADGEAHVVFWQEEYGKNALLLDGAIYLDLETVLTKINKNFIMTKRSLCCRIRHRPRLSGRIRWKLCITATNQKRSCLMLRL